jgi:hypothetical protein
MVKSEVEWDPATRATNVGARTGEIEVEGGMTRAESVTSPEKPSRLVTLIVETISDLGGVVTLLGSAMISKLDPVTATYTSVELVTVELIVPVTLML